MGSPEFTRGVLESLSKHPCTDRTSNSTSDCCKFDYSSQQCGIYFFGQFQHPCALCSEEEVPIPTQRLCNFCSESYPNASMGEIVVLDNRTKIDNIIDHQCAINNGGDTSHCCLHDAAYDQCGIFMNDTFVAPCGDCVAPNGNREISDGALYGLVGGSIAVVMILSISYCWNKCYYQNAKSREMVVKRDEPTAVPVEGCEEQIMYADIVPLEDGSGFASFPNPVPVPVPP